MKKIALMAIGLSHLAVNCMDPVATRKRPQRVVAQQTASPALKPRPTKRQKVSYNNEPINLVSDEEEPISATIYVPFQTVNRGDIISQGRMPAVNASVNYSKQEYDQDYQLFIPGKDGKQAAYVRYFSNPELNALSNVTYEEKEHCKMNFNNYVTGVRSSYATKGINTPSFDTSCIPAQCFIDKQ